MAAEIVWRLGACFCCIYPLLFNWIVGPEAGVAAVLGCGTPLKQSAAI